MDLAHWGRYKYLENFYNKSTQSKSILLKWSQELKNPKNKNISLDEMVKKFPEIKKVVRNNITYFKVNDKLINSMNKRTHQKEIKRILKGGKTITPMDKKIKQLYQISIVANCHAEASWDTTNSILASNKLIAANHDYYILEELVLERLEQIIKEKVAKPNLKTIESFTENYIHFKAQQNYILKMINPAC